MARTCENLFTDNVPQPLILYNRAMLQHYSADLGDFRSFVEHMRAKAEKQGVDLLLMSVLLSTTVVAHKLKSSFCTVIPVITTMAAVSSLFLLKVQTSPIITYLPSSMMLLQSETTSFTSSLTPTTYIVAWSTIDGRSSLLSNIPLLTIIFDRSGRFLTSNVNITLTNGTSLPLGNHMSKFRTKQWVNCIS